MEDEEFKQKYSKKLKQALIMMEILFKYLLIFVIFCSLKRDI